MASPYDPPKGQQHLTIDTNIIDAYGRPIVRELLERELAFPTMTGIRTIWQDAVSPGLDPVTMAGLLQDAAQGNHEAYLILAEEMEEKDLHYAAQLGTRKRAVVRLPIDVDAASKSAQDEKIAAAVREMIDGDNFRNLLEEQLDALGKGYSVNEICWDRSGKVWTPEAYKWRDPRFFLFDLITRAKIRVRDIKNPAFGVPLAPYKFIVHYPRLKCGIPLRGGLARLVAWSFLFKNYTIKDWVSFVEIFGMPLRIGRYDANSVTEKDLSVLKMAVANIGSDAAAVLPRSMEIEFQEAAKGTGGEKLFLGLATYLDKQVSKAILGQTMTADDGSSQAQAKVHDEVRGDIRDADAMQLAATINRDLIRPFVDFNFGPQKDYPKFKFITAEPDDLVSKSTRDGNLSKNSGVRFSASYFEREYGFQSGDILGVGLPAQEIDAALTGGKPPVKAALKGALNRENNEPFPGETEIDALAESFNAETLQELVEGPLKPIFDLVKLGGNMADLMDDLVKLYPEMDTDTLQNMLAGMIFVSEVWGRIQADEQKG